jgi:ATPase subunit of ABC transporter with duplicated ATPase domains
MLSIQGVTYIHPNGDLLFSDLNLSINKKDKIALVGNNGAGKSTLLKILSGKLDSHVGVVKSESVPYYVPQVAGRFGDATVSQVLQVHDKLKAITEILAGNPTQENLELIDNDWAIEERCREALEYWNLYDTKLDQKMDSLSGGQKTKVLLSGIQVHQPNIILLDEPSNHLDAESRDILYHYIHSMTKALLVVSHDRTLLDLVTSVWELNKQGITAYGGNYAFYAEQKEVELDAMHAELREKEKALRKARATERESLERQQKLDSRGKKKQEKAGLPTIMMKTFKNSAEKSTARLKDVHNDKINNISQQLADLRNAVPDADKIKVDMGHSELYVGKMLLRANGINFSYNENHIWQHDVTLEIRSGERVAVNGPNGAGKTTLIRIILAQLEPRRGTIERATGMKSIYVDQDYSILDNKLTVYEQAQQYNQGSLQEHDVKIRLNRFLFSKEDWNKTCQALSGGERMRLTLCLLTIANQAPDLIVLDEPTNNLDIQNIQILIASLNQYKGTVLVVSHDRSFLQQIKIEKAIQLN